MRRLFVMVLVGALMLGACGDDDSDTETSGGTATTTADHADDHDHGGGSGEPTCSPSGTTLSIVASQVKFDKDCLAVPADQSFTISYENKDTIPHSLVFLKSHSSNENLFPGAEVFTGPKTVTLNGPALQAGNYAFHCTVHPSVMKGSFIVK